MVHDLISAYFRPQNCLAVSYSSSYFIFWMNMALNPLPELHQGNIHGHMYVYMSRLYHHHGVTDDGNIKNTVYGSPLCPGEPDIWRNTLLNFPNGDAMMALNPLPELHQGNIHGHMYVYMSRLCHHHGVTDDGDIKNNVYGSPLCLGKPDIKFMRYTFFYH